MTDSSIEERPSFAWGDVQPLRRTALLWRCGAGEVAAVGAGFELPGEIGRGAGGL